MTGHYTPQDGSVAARVIAELQRKPRVLTSGDIGKLLDLPSASVGASMKAAVQYGAVQMRVVNFGARSRCEYFPNGYTPPDAVVDTVQRGKAQPLAITMYEDGEVHVYGHKIGVDNDVLAVFSAKQIAYLVARVCTPIVEVSP